MNRSDPPPGATPASIAPGDAIVVFDGVCVLCSRWVAFLLRHDRRARFRFAAMQGDAGAALMREHGLDAMDPDSFLLIDERGAHTDSDAVIAVLVQLGGAWKIAGGLSVLPAWLRDHAYRWLARNRYRWFGKRERCLLPTAGHRARFL